MIDRSRLPVEVQHLSRGGLLGALGIDPSEPTRTYRPWRVSLGLLAAQVAAEKTALVDEAGEAA